MSKHCFCKISFIFLLIIASLINTACSSLILATSGSGLTDTHHGKRTLGSRIEDQSIEAKTLINIKNSDPAFKHSHIIVVSYDGYTLLTGQTQSADLKRQAGDIAKKIRHVERVYNEITVSGPTSLLARLNDAWISTKVKTSLLLHQDFPASHTKIVTENSTVYLMGLLTEEETDKAVKIIKRTYGIQKIVRLVEYIN